MSIAEKSLQLFQQGVAEKRAGNYARALQLQKESIRIYPDDPDIMSAYYAMGKVHYLAKNFSYSFACYQVYNNLCLIKNPPILADYKAALNGDEQAKYRLIPAFENLAKHVGHAFFDPKENGHEREKQWYAYELAGKHPDEMSAMKPYKDSALSFEQEITTKGFDIIFYWFNKFLENPRKEQNDTVALMKDLVK